MRIRTIVRLFAFWFNGLVVGFCLHGLFMPSAPPTLDGQPVTFITNLTPPVLGR